MANPQHYGNHMAEVVHWDIPDTEKEHPQVLVELKIVSEGPARGVSKFWYGSLNPTVSNGVSALEITLRALVEMGFRGMDGDLSALIQDPNATTENTALTRGKQVPIQVYPHTYNGKTYERINIGARPSAASMPVAKAKGKLDRIKALAAMHMAKSGVTSEDVPF